MIAAKQIADFISLFRLFIAFWLAWLGVSHGRAGLPVAAWLMIASWTSDVIDGPIARRSRKSYQTWLGDHDLEIDIAVSGGLLVYLMATELVDPRLGLLYVLVWAALFIRFGISRAPGMLVQAPIYGWFIVVAFRIQPAAGWWMTLWILGFVAITWPKFPSEIVPGFLQGMRVVWDQHKGSIR